MRKKHNKFGYMNSKTIKKIVELRCKGKTVEEISTELKVNRDTVAYYLFIYKLL